MNTISISNFSLAALLLLAGCTANSNQQASEEPVRSVPVTEVSILDTVFYHEYVAGIQAVKNVELRARVTGFLEEIYVDEGKSVSKGQVLFKINDEEFIADVAREEARLNSAMAEVKTIELETKRTRLLVEKNIISDTELELAEAQLKAAKAKADEARSALQHAKNRLSYTLVKAPFHGRIDRIPLKTGSLLTEGSLLTTVSDLHEVYAYFDISETEYLEMAAREQHKKFSKTVRMTLANGQEYPYEGYAELAESEFAANTGSISLRARFPNPGNLLKHGASGRVKVPSDESRVLVVPQKAVFEIQDKTYVYCINERNEVKMTPFEAGPRFGHYYLVRSGLKEREKIVFEGVRNLRDGIIIEPRTTPADSLVIAAN